MEKVSGSNWDGIYYPVNNRKDKVIIALSGSEGGNEHAGKCAHYLSDHGIPAIGIAYFKSKHAQKNLDRVPVEVIGSVISWLKEKGYEKIGIEGASKGSELALASSLVYDDLSCVILKTPSYFYSEGMIKKTPSNTSCWSYQGKELPFTPYKERKFNLLKNMWKEKEYNILPINTGKKVTEESIIQVANIKAPILMFSTKVDTIWPSTDSCIKMCERLDEHHFDYPYKHIAFVKMSHMMLEYCGSEIRFFIKSERQYPEQCAKEREIMGKEAVDWIENVWK